MAKLIGDAAMTSAQCKLHRRDNLRALRPAIQRVVPRQHELDRIG